jgi:cytochrome P450
MLPYLASLLAQKRAQIQALPATATPPTDTFSRLIRTEFPAELEFGDTRIVANVAGLLIGTVETSSQAIVQVIAQLLGRPATLAAAQAAARAGDDTSFDGYVWEALRFDPINPLIFRLCESDYVLAGGTPHQTTIMAGTVVFACTESAMFDHREVPDPETFNPRRPDYQMMFFGYGAHTCLGKYVALMMVPEVVKQVLLRPNVRLIPGAAGQLDFQGGFFPERFTIAYGPPAAMS